MKEENRQLSLKTVLFVLLPLCLAVKAWGASFDCGKATTKVEKIICADAELSKLDEEMGKAHIEAMKKAPDPAAFKQQQRDWLKEQNSCEDTSCLLAQYHLRIGELSRIISLVPLAEGQESHYFEKEADKLKVMQDIVRRQAFSFSPPYMQEPKFCTEFMSDFVAGRNIEAVEPDFRSNDKDDPRFAKLNRCRDNIPEQGTSASDFYHVAILGGPPYRYYRLDLDGNPENGKEDVLYHEAYKVQGDTIYSWIGNTGYSWIDATECTVKGGTGVYMQTWENAPRNLYRLNILAIYRGMPISLELHPSYWAPYPTKYSFDTMRFDKSKKPVTCGWSPDLSNKKTTGQQKTESNGGK